MRLPIILVAVLLAGLLCANTAQAQTKDWTFLVYLDADNNLESAGIDDFLEMAAVGSDERVNIVIQFDRIASYTDTYGDWQGCLRYKIERGMEPYAANALQDLGEANMGDPATLQDFIQWGVTNYPAEKYALVLWNHGGGWRVPNAALPSRAVCWDDTNGGDTLYTKEVVSAIAASGADIDLIGFDACVMAMIEVAYEIRSLADVMVASEENEPNDGWPYTEILQALTLAPTQNAATLGTHIVNEYAKSYTLDVTQSAIDLTTIEAVVADVNLLAQAMISSPDNEDLVRARASSVMTALSGGTVLANHSDFTGANGLTVNFPTFGAETDYTSANIAFAADASWEVFLDTYAASLSGGWIGQARAQTRAFHTGYADLYDFCRLLGGTDGNIPQPVGYVMTEVAYEFEDISASGVHCKLSDESTHKLNPPFAIPIYGQSFPSVYVGSNGTLQTTSVVIDYNIDALPTSHQSQVFLAPFWCDLDPGSSGTVYAEIRGTAPNRRLIVQWDDVKAWNALADGTGATFQLVIHEDGVLQYNYADMDFNDAAYDFGAAASVGMQYAYATATQYSFRSAVLTGPTSLRFTPESPDSFDFAMFLGAICAPSPQP